MPSNTSEPTISHSRRLWEAGQLKMVGPDEAKRQLAELKRLAVETKQELNRRAFGLKT
jgi:hypothetical protein